MRPSGLSSSVGDPSGETGTPSDSPWVSGSATSADTAGSPGPVASGETADWAASVASTSSAGCSGSWGLG
ncbi:hypothetical protein [Actinomyces sp. Marseille-P3109]|uniref:hypothetical protein n=1 Tax=Actinomyces sp. Marseille-P3109 TaxID=2083009 RepID=UPI001F31B050|nr:hypothetical protein [Actinomyces sp. Marseille-P3109]